MRIILFFFSKLFVEIVLEFCNSRNETIGSCFIIFSPRENMKIFILISTEEFSIRESIISRSVFFSYFLRVIRGRFTFSEGRTNFLKCCTFNELWQARFFRWKARATDWQDEFSFYFPLLGSGGGRPSTLLASTTRAIPSGQKWNGELWRRIIHLRTFVSSKRFIRIDKEGNGYRIARTGIGNEN